MMKRCGMLLLLVCVLMLGGCGSRGWHTVQIVIPAGSQEEYAYSEEVFFPKKDSVTIMSGKGLGDTMVVLLPMGETQGEYRPTYLTHGMPVTMEVEPGTGYRVGVSVQNSSSGEDVVVYVDVKDVEEAGENVSSKDEEFQILIHQDAENAIYGIRYEYYLADTPIGGGETAQTEHGTMIPFETGDRIPLRFPKQGFPEDADLNALSVEVYIVDQAGKETKTANDIRISADFGKKYSFRLTGDELNYFVEEM